MNSQIPLSSTASFWTDIAPCEHLVHLYHNDASFLDTLENFVVAGLGKGEAVVLIATPEHQEALNARLSRRGVNLEAARGARMYFALDAEESLQKFMVRGWPDESLFQHFVYRTLERAGERKVRAFGEMLALLWARGQSSAMIRLEQLWHSLCQRDGLALLCAYPRSAFTPDAETALDEICAAHSCVVR